MEENLNEILPGLDLQNLIQFLLAFFLTSIRLSAFFISAPLFNAAFFMVRIRILIAMVVSVIVFSTQDVEVDVSVLTSAFGIVVIAKEIAIMKETKKSIKKNILLPLQDNELFGLIINSLKSPSVY